MRLVIMVLGIVAVVGLGLGTRFFLSEDGADQTADIINAATPARPADGVGSTTTDIPLPQVPSGQDDIALSQTPEAPSAPSAPSVDTNQEIPSFTPQPEPVGAPFGLTLPLDCSYGNNCYIQSYVNAGLETEPRDYACGALTQAEHRGTDFRLIDFRQMETGVAVIAAAPGEVVIVQDGMPDANFKLFGESAISGRELGNFIAIDHGNGIVTSYAHLKRGSTMVLAGERVARGQPIALVGMSGLSEFPHMQFEVMSNGLFLDPFTGAARHEGCGLDGDPLWREDVAQLLTYPRTLVMRKGFSDRILNRAAVEYQLFTPPPLTQSANALVLHVYLSGIQEGDGFVAEITAPDGSRFVKSGRRFEQFQQTELLAIGRDQLAEPLQVGNYTAVFQYFRRDDSGEDIQILTLEETVTVQ